MVWALGAVAVACGVAVFVVDSMARATFALLASFLCTGGLLMAAGLHYPGVLVILMMIMEMLVMAVFMVMYMMNPAGLMPMSMLHNRRGALAVAGTAFAAMVAGIVAVPWPERAGRPPDEPAVALGEAIMGSKMLVMMVIGVAILATMIATVVLAMKSGRYGDDA
ncbi:NADH-quinone oxidoreductase subunit J [Actinomadura algeriensis]|uniref:NADH-quinone oxidoreductase subunit J n=1 Tax=Actinomadura algeriensis TaxID=1679523 RepID=A0ABR9JX63_9ACTN|nr:NADH-quinone oxidoreductase subunit J [Actinomadura algeriensis]MBE1534705.1 NADH:ubiquinone oxidoreductase subunit 6 (subunit J) [Actinomadura algeriensis]